MNIISRFVLLLAFLGLCWSLEDLCPAEDMLKPCTCTTYLDGACIVTCTLSSQKDIDRIADIPNLCRGNVHFVLVHSKVDGIPVKLWRTLLQSETVDVSIKHSGVGSLVPPGSTEMIGKVSTPGEAVIKVTHTKMAQWDWTQLAEFFSEGELTLVVEDTPLSELGSDFQNIAAGRVHKVNIDSAGLSKVQDQEFVAFGDLNSLSLQNNELTVVTRSMISRPANKLQYLHLNGNKLVTIPGDMFKEMPALEVVYLRDNLLKTLPVDLLRDVSRKFQRIDFVNNPFECDCALLTALKCASFPVNLGTCAGPAELEGVKVRDIYTRINC